MKTAVDTNVLLDLLAGDNYAAEAARIALLEASSAGPITISSIVFAELAAGFGDSKETSQFIHDLEISVDDFSPEAVFQAATAWKKYVTRRGKEILCPKCGHTVEQRCPACQSTIAWRQHIITDFLIGGHALSQADRLLTRDRGYYSTYFPNLRLETP